MLMNAETEDTSAGVVQDVLTLLDHINVDAGEDLDFQEEDAEVHTSKFNIA